MARVFAFPDSSKPHLRGGAVTLGYVILAVALTWPLATSLGGHLPLGTEQVASVPALNAWTVWWNADRARYGFSEYWHAPIFSPSRYAFAFSEAQPTSLIVAPVVYAAGPAAAYNIYLLAVLTLNGVVTYRLLKRVGLAVVPALLGGALVETLPMVHWQLGVLQLTTIGGVIWTIDRLVALRDAPRIVNAALLGVAAFLCYAACNYFGLFLSVLLPLTFLPLIFGRWLDWRFWLLAAAAAVVAGTLSLPILWAQFEAKREYEWHRDESLIVSLSAQPRDYLTTPWKPRMEGPGFKDPKRPLWMLGGGPFKLILAVAGIVAGFCMRGRRRWTLFLILFGAAAFGLSLGPAVEIRQWSPYKAVMAWHPGLALARSPFRFAFFVQLATAMLAANAIDGFWRATFAVGRRFNVDVVAWSARVAGAQVGLASSKAAANSGAVDRSSDGSSAPESQASERPLPTELPGHPQDGVSIPPWVAGPKGEQPVAPQGGRHLRRHALRDLGPATRRRSAVIGMTVVAVSTLLTIAAGVYGLAEVWPARQRLLPMPATDRNWIEWLRRNSDPASPILCLPFPMGASVGDYERTSIFMLEQIGHRRPMVGGYSGFFPPEFLRLKDMMEGFPDEAVMTELRLRGVTHVVVADAAWFRRADRSPSLRLAFHDEDAKVRVYKVLPPPIDYERFFNP